MLRIDQARVFPRVLGISLAGLLLIGNASGAFAKPRIKKSLAPTPALEQTVSPVAMTPVRFFTINQVLAKQAGQSAAKPGTIEVAAIVSSASGVLSDAPASKLSMPSVSEEPFGLFVFRAPEGLLWTKWRGVEARMRAELKSIADCEADGENCPAGARKFLSLVSDASKLEGRSRVEVVNRGLNNVVRYVGDYQQHGVADLWSSPLETLSSGVGDCEDYAIAKYAVLAAAGIAETDLKMLLVRDRAVRQDHAVLAVRIDGRWVILDNRYSSLSETRDLSHFMPLFAIDGTGVSLFAAPYAERALHESETDMLPATAASSFGGGSTLPLVF